MPKEFVVQMGIRYPFGELGQVIDENTYTSVCKRLFHTSIEEYQQIQEMIHFLKTSRHQKLINLKQVLQCQAELRLYYQYVPFRLEGWLLDVNEQLLKQLEEQFLQLAEFLSRSRVKFTFDPECVGVSAQMTLKYFLHEFVVDVENSEENLQNLRKEIRYFFKSIKKSKRKVSQREESAKVVENDLKKSVRMGSISTNGSYSTQEDLTSLTESLIKLKVDNQNKKATKGAMITAKLQNSKRKFYEILQRCKNISSK